MCIIFILLFYNRFWIFFKDKGSIDKNLITEYEKSIPDLTLERRFNSIGKAYDFGDLPIPKDYINQLKSFDIKLRYKSRWLNAVSVECDEKKIEKVSMLHFVRKIEPVKVLTMKMNLNQMETRYGYNSGNMRILKIDTLHSLGYTGNGIRIGVFDTGFEFGKNKHEALEDVKVIAKGDFVFPDTMIVNGDTIIVPDTIVGYEVNEDWRDDNYPLCFWGWCSQTDHGTEILSILAGYKSSKIIGVAFNAEYVLAKTELVFDRNGDMIELRREEDNWIAALEWAESLGVHIITSSIGYKFFDDGGGYSYADLNGENALITIAADSAVRRGVFVFNAMGNVSMGALADTSIVAPADGKYVFSIGGIDTLGRWSSISAKGPTIDGRIKPDFVAPISAMVVNPEWSKEIMEIPGFDTIYIPKYISAAGTSVSTPYVAGLIALLLEAHPSWIGKIDKVKNILIESSSNEGIPNDSTGYGYIDGLKALYYETPEIDYSDIVGKLIVYPNPVKINERDFFTVSCFLNKEAFVSIKIYDSGGFNIFTKSFGYILPGEFKERIKIENFRPGLYFIVLSTEKFKIYEKLFII